MISFFIIFFNHLFSHFHVNFLEFIKVVFIFFFGKELSYYLIKFIIRILIPKCFFKILFNFCSFKRFTIIRIDDFEYFFSSKVKCFLFIEYYFLNFVFIKISQQGLFSIYLINSMLIGFITHDPFWDNYANQTACDKCNCMDP